MSLRVRHVAWLLWCAIHHGVGGRVLRFWRASCPFVACRGWRHRVIRSSFKITCSFIRNVMTLSSLQSFMLTVSVVFRVCVKQLQQASLLHLTTRSGTAKFVEMSNPERHCLCCLSAHVVPPHNHVWKCQVELSVMVMGLKRITPHPSRPPGPPQQPSSRLTAAQQPRRQTFKLFKLSHPPSRTSIPSPSPILPTAPPSA